MKGPGTLSPCTGSRLPGGLTRQGGKHTLQRPKGPVPTGMLCHSILSLSFSLSLSLCIHTHTHIEREDTVRLCFPRYLGDGVTVCFFVLCKRHWINRVPGFPVYTLHLNSDAGYAVVPLTLLGAPVSIVTQATTKRETKELLRVRTRRTVSLSLSPNSPPPQSCGSGGLTSCTMRPLA